MQVAHHMPQLDQKKHQNEDSTAIQPIRRQSIGSAVDKARQAHRGMLRLQGEENQWARANKVQLRPEALAW